MNIRFYIDPTTGLPHIYNHDVDEEEVEDVLDTPGEDRPGRAGSRIASGQTRGGRFLRVIYVRDPKPDSIFVITAYEFEANRSSPTVGASERRTDETESLPRWLERRESPQVTAAL